MAEDRRTALKVISGVFGCTAASAVGVPALRAVLSPVFTDTMSSPEGFVPIAALARVPDRGPPVRVTVVLAGVRDAWNVLPPSEVGAVWIQRRGESLTVHSTVCPHLGCGIDYDSAADAFVCPCHTSKFGRDGSVSGGPSPRPLDRLEARVAQGRIEIRYQRFKPGTPEQVPA